MDQSNVVEPGSPHGECVCRESPTLDVLRQVQNAYEEKMRKLDALGGNTKLQKQVELLKSWVSDLVGQNTLLARALEEMESQATLALHRHHQKCAEMASEQRAELCSLRARMARKDADLRGLLEVLRRLREFDHCSLDGIHFHEVTESDVFGSMEWRQKNMEQGDVTVEGQYNKYKSNRFFKNLERRKTSEKEKELLLLNDALQKEIITKDKELRKLNKDLHSCETLIFELKKELTICSSKVLPPTPAPMTCDAEVMAGMCCVKPECGEMEPVRDYSEPLLPTDLAAYQDRIHNMETKLKASGKNIQALGKANVTLSIELYATRCICAALGEECAAAKMTADFKDDIIREMRRQLKWAKAKMSNTMELTSSSQREGRRRDYCPSSGTSLEAALSEAGRGGAGARGGHPRAYSDSEARSPRLAAPTAGRIIQ